ncbi:MAG: GatB/YqeY domain-containing protein [Alphaproteobacteria bacterium]|nr:GatB/YqeY domain-containing protein [Alphaproteobacteria bacterium]
MLRDDLRDALKTAMIEKSDNKVSTIRLIIAAIKDRDIAARSTGNLDGISDAEILVLLQSMIKQRNDSIEMYTKGGRSDLAEAEKSEIDIIRTFMPKQLGEAETASAISEAISATGAVGLKDMGKVMALLREKYAGQIDFSQASVKVKEQLAQI